MTETMIEKLAEVVADAEWNGVPVTPWASLPEYPTSYGMGKKRCRAIARAVLIALREPSEGVKVTGGLALEEDMFNNCQEGTVFDTAGVCFTAMIDHILNENGSSRSDP
jgi:hypothetical protein